ncbi:MAG: LCP family protein [Anaerolineales bacterium]|nr:LCP family protein [Anaerolineales bacterium]
MNENKFNTNQFSFSWTLVGALFALVFVAAACTSVAGGFLSGAASLPLATIPTDATATATPFNPVEATITPTPLPPTTATPQPSPTPIDPWENFPPPVEVSAIDIRRPLTPHEHNDELINIMLLGSDQRPNEYGHRTDVMMLVSIDPREHTVKLLSFPRDLYVFIPGRRVDRINVADAVGGSEMVKNTILYNFGLEVDHLVRINFYGFMGVVDALGGIDVEVGAYLSDKCGRQWTYSPGEYHMDGFQALCYMRMRKTTGDFDRLRREQEVIMALFKKVLSIDGLTRVPEMYDQFKTFVETDMGLDDVFVLLPTAVDVARDPSVIEHYDIGPDMGSLWRVPYSGASVILPDWDAIEAMLVESFGLPVQNREG